MKVKLRKEILGLRNSLSKEKVEEYSRKITNNIVNTYMYDESKHIFTFLNFNNEVSTKEIINNCIEKSKCVYIPLCNTQIKEIVLCKFEDWNELATNKLGILEPKKESIRIADRNVLDLAIVPGAVFDRSGNRVGYGAGYYDKFFFSMNRTIIKIGICYSFQMVEKIKPWEHDVPMDYIITEKEIIECKKYR